jgi:hypothetical protein
VPRATFRLRDLENAIVETCDGTGLEFAHSFEEGALPELPAQQRLTPQRHFVQSAAGLASGDER